MKSTLVIVSCLLFVASAVVQQASFGGFYCVDGFCANGGTCNSVQGSASGPSFATCTCAPGFFGATCEFKYITDCWGNSAPDVWVGDGICQNGNAKFGGNFISLNCLAHDFDNGDCGTAATTPNTHTACTTTTCGTGKCYGSNSQYWCSCPRNSAGSACQVTVDGCTPNPCQNGARCISDITATYNYLCICASESYSDKNCSTVASGGGSSGGAATCSTGCSGHGICYATNACFCNTGYYGSFTPDCAPNTACDSSPCQNGGTCNKDTSTNTYSCTCASGYEGTNCQTSIAVCHPEPCLHNGVCKDAFSFSAPSYNCYCTDAYRGINCTFPTANGFSCTGNTYDASFIPPGWIGDGVCENQWTYLATVNGVKQSRFVLVGDDCVTGAGDKDCPSETPGTGFRLTISFMALALMSITYFL